MFAVKDKAAEVLRGLFGGEPSSKIEAVITEQLPFAQSGLDSLDVLESVIELEMAFDVELPDAEVGDCKTFDELVALIERQKAGA